MLVGQQDDVEWLEALLFEADPIGIASEDNADEYRPEAETIQRRRAEAGSAADVRRIVHEEFVRWFDEHLAGPPERYEQVARRLWERWNSDSPTTG